MKPGIVAVIGLAVVLTACAPAAPAVDIAAETEALGEAIRGYSAAGGAFDPAAMASFYADDAIAMPPNEGNLVGPAAFAAFGEELAGMEGFSVSVDPPEVVMGAGGDMAYTYGMVRITMPGPDGELITTEERDVHVWRKQADGTWKIAVDIWNSMTPLPTPDEG
jgi:ketosteroid isomerase-like protein